ncbi:MAG TPA: HAD-IIIC family phosphatase [Clostridiales bacterium]|nr:HAD-IIIC family phosphatase [Clostridiales bacterium]
MESLVYPFDSSEILKNRKKIKKVLLGDETTRIQKNIAILGGSTTNDIATILELFLLNYGIEPVFYQSEYGQYWQDSMFNNQELDNFKPDIIFIHTTNRNITEFEFDMTSSAETVEYQIQKQYLHFETMWQTLTQKYNCPIVQNNYEMPSYRLLGNKDSSDVHGKLWFINCLNMKFSEYAQNHGNFYINDINYLSACYGLDKWSDAQHWYLYKYALSLSAIPELAYNISNIIKSIFGKNKKALALDLDNTLWGGVVGDDGQNGLEIGQETPVAQAYYEFQSYIKQLKKLGITLTVCSKNDIENALDGLKHPDTVLTADDFVIIKANWDNKDENILKIASELNILPESIVFVDDNPAEREIVKSRLPMVATPEIKSVESYIKALDRTGYFEVTTFSDDDVNRNDMYKANIQRLIEQQQFESYDDYLLGLKMTATIEGFKPVYLERIVQLANKSNQFNLTTKRYTEGEIQKIYQSDDYVKLYGRLTDKFGDNGVVSVVIGKIEADTLNVELWLMSCRVLKRDMEYAMLDTLVEKCIQNNITKINGYYYKTVKNAMVSDLYARFGFKQISSNNNGDSVWELDLHNYKNKNNVITVNSEKELVINE